MSDSDDDIPTLNEVIFPGRPERVRRPADSDGADSGKARPTPRPRTATARPGNFEQLIGRQIDRILERHLQAAREEIVRVLMIELRSRLPQAARRATRKPGDGDD